MKKGKILISVLLTGLVIVGLSLTFNDSRAKKDFKIDDALSEKLEELTERQEISVIVMTNKEFEEKGIKITRGYKTIPGFSAKVSKKEIENIAKLNSVEKIYLNKPVRALLDESIPQISANQVWLEGITGSGIKICVVDTGIDYNHQDLTGKVIAQTDIINGDDDAMDDNGHGTWVAGAIVSNNATYKGVAPGASLLVAKVLDASGSGSYDSVLAGIDWCVDQGVEIINVSLGGQTFPGTCDNDPLSIAVNSTVSQGVVVSVAAGNEGVSGITTPACASQAIAVGAVDKSGYVPWWSSEGSELDILAPGVDITSLYPQNQYASGSGTSISSPHISGTVALLLETKPSATIPEVKEAIYSTATSATGCYECRLFWRDKCYGQILTSCDPGDVGAGIINAYQAYLKIKPIEPECAVDSDCDDGLYCNGGETCISGFCQAGTLVDCSALNDQCNDGICDEATDSCLVQPKVGGTPCDDKLYCNIGETCQAGVCTGGLPRNCDDDEPCTTDTCNEETDTCQNTWPSCDLDDNCCGPTCNSNDPDCPIAVQCWSKDYQYLYRNNGQAKKFCKCAQGSYGYLNYALQRIRATVYRYLDTSDNENWELSSRSSYWPIYQVICPDNQAYPTDQDYYYPK